MRFSDFVAASMAAAPFVAAHGDAGAPKIFGMPKHLKTREFLSGQKNVATPARSPRLQSRQGGTAEGRCGANFGGASCAAGYCCSAEGYCGNTGEHCAAPDCQINYGPGCDANQTPAGSSTRNDARPQLGNIEYGGLGIRSCLKAKTVAITYDDGPYIYTTEVMDMFKQYNAKATFFITGNNIGKGAIDTNWRGVIQDMYARGHQIASHTWSHQNLDSITSAQRYDQMVKNEMALRNIIGKYPTYMRPPYSACDSASCQADMKALGYVVTSFDLDTDDYNQLTTEKIETAKANFKNGIDSAKPNGDQLAIAHDIHELTARNLTPYMLKYVYDNGFTAVTVGECMGDPEANWYRDSTPAPLPSSSASASASASASSSAPVPTPTGPTTTNGACGTANADGKGQSCVGFVGPDGLSECCSQYGYCGRSADYCQTGCNPLFGKCGTQPSVVPSSSASVTATSSAPVPTVSLPTSPDAQCGATAGYTCKGFTIGGVKAECCSQYNYCGNTEAYCGTGCNPLYGNCGVSVSSSIASSSASASVSSSAVVSSSASSSAPVSSKASSSAVSSSAPISSKASSSAVSSSAPISSKASSSAVSSSTPVSSKVSSVASSSAPASSKASSVASVSGSASASRSGSASASPSVSKASSSVASASASVSKSESASVKPSSVSASPSASKSASSSGSATPSVSKPASSSGSATPSVSKPASSAATSYSVTIPQVSSTPAPSSKPASSSAQPSTSTPVSKPASSSPASSSGGVYPGGSTISTVVKPSSTPCTTSSSASPTPSKPVISKDGKCGSDNGGQTCAGYRNGFGWKIECCCKESGRCSTDPWACGIGCDKAYGNCWF